MTQPYTDAEVELVAETVAANLGLEAWQVRTAARIALRALAAAESVDEHGNRTDTCGVCTLAPSVSGWARATQARCPVHGSPPYNEEDTDGR